MYEHEVVLPSEPEDSELWELTVTDYVRTNTGVDLAAKLLEAGIWTDTALAAPGSWVIKFVGGAVRLGGRMVGSVWCTDAGWVLRAAWSGPCQLRPLVGKSCTPRAQRDTALSVGYQAVAAVVPHMWPWFADFLRDTAGPVVEVHTAAGVVEVHRDSVPTQIHRWLAGEISAGRAAVRGDLPACLIRNLAGYTVLWPRLRRGEQHTCAYCDGRAALGKPPPRHHPPALRCDRCGVVVKWVKQWHQHACV